MPATSVGPPGTMIRIGQEAPDFSLPSSSGRNVHLGDYRGKNIILYFYPRDNTPGCTREACEFRDNHARLNKLGTVVLGISPDHVESHQKFSRKHDLPFLLLSDVDRKVARLYGVWKKKRLYGRSFYGIIRTTFVINEVGMIRHRFDNVRVVGHSDRVIHLLAEGG